MFDGGYREAAAAKIEIPNIRFVVFEAMMRCVYSAGQGVEVPADIAQELLQAADQYLLEGAPPGALSRALCGGEW